MDTRKADCIHQTICNFLGIHYHFCLHLRSCEGLRGADVLELVEEKTRVSGSLIDKATGEPSDLGQTLRKTRKKSSLY